MGNKVFLRGVILTVSLALFALALSTCGGGRGPVGRPPACPPQAGEARNDGGVQVPALQKETTLDEALAELDALPTPEGVDESLFSQLKEALREALVHGVGARHAVPLREDEALLDRVGRGFIPAEGAARLKSRPTEPGSAAFLSGDAPTTSNEQPTTRRGAETPPYRIVSKPPTGESNRVDDLELIDNGDGTYTLTWSYRNRGDYNQDGIVNIMDITPLAVHFNEPADETNECIDGNADSVINITDITPLAANFFCEVAGYSIRGADAPEGEFREIGTAAFSLASGEGHKRFQVSLPESPFKCIAVAPFDSGNLLGQLSNIVERNLPPVAVLTAEPTDGIVPLMVSFDASESYDPDGTIVKYEWDWEGDRTWDMDTADTPTSSHTYEDDAVYRPRVRITDDQGLRGYAGTRTSTRVAAILSVSAEPKDVVGEAPLEVMFHVTCSGGFPPYDFEWDFTNDGSGDSLDQNPTFTYSSQGGYRAAVTVTDCIGNSSTDTVDVTVLPPSPPPEAGIDANPLEGPSPLQVEFSGYAVDGTPPYTFDWDFENDGVWESSGESAMHLFSEPAAYGVRLRVTDSKGKTDDETVLIVATGGSPGRGDWWMFGGGAKHQRRTSHVGPEAPELKWKYQLGAEPGWVEPVFASDGTLYIGSRDGAVYALNPDGTLKWRFELEGLSGHEPLVMSTLAVGEDGAIYVPGWYSNFYALNPDGQRLWEHIWGGFAYHPAIGTDGTIYVGAVNWMLAYRPDGTVQWANDEVEWPTDLIGPAIGEDGAIYVNSDQDYLFVYSSGGELILRYDINQWGIGPSPAIGEDGTVYVGSADGNLYALTSEAALKWTFQSYPWINESVAIGEDGTIYLNGADRDWNSFLFAINPDGSLEWAFPKETSSASSPTVDAEGKVFVADANVYCVKPNGELQWSFRPEARVRLASPSIGPDGTLYVADDEGTLYAIGD